MDPWHKVVTSRKDVRKQGPLSLPEQYWLLRDPPLLSDRMWDAVFLIFSSGTLQLEI